MLDAAQRVAVNICLLNQGHKLQRMPSGEVLHL